MAGLSTPLHLAASLLTLAAAVGLAIAAMARSDAAGGRPGAAESGMRLLIAAGALLIAAGSGLAGALLEPANQTVSWLRAAGLALIAIGLSPLRLRQLTSAAAVSPLLLAPAPPSVLAGLAGAVAAFRALTSGRRTAVVGVAFGCWGAIGLVAPWSATGAAGLELTGAVLLGWWLWLVSQRRLLSKLVTAFVAALLFVVVLLASVLSTVSTGRVVVDQLARLEGFSDQLAGEVASQWPAEAVRLTRALSPAGQQFLELRAQDRAELTGLYQPFFHTQDFFVTLDADGRPINWYGAPDGALADSFLLAISGSEVVERILTQDAAAGGLLTVGGRIVALGGAQLLPKNPRPADRPLGVLLTGRILDERWVSAQARARDIGIVVEVGDRLSAASADLPAAELVPRTGPPPAGPVQAGGDTFYRAGRGVVDDDLGTEFGRLYAIGRADTVAGLQQAGARQLFRLALFGALFAAGVGWAVSRRLVAPIRSLTVAAAAVREGDLGVRPRVVTGDEVGELGRAFNEMTQSLAVQSTQLREAATVQTRLRARLEALTASMSDALVAVDGEGRVVTFNPAAERLVGRRFTEVRGLPLEHVLTGKASPQGGSAVRALGAPDGQQIVAAQVLLEAQGRWIPVSVTAAPVRDTSGRVLGRVFVLRDVTREAELERMKAEFLANVSHELRTPLTPIKGYAEVLARREVSQESTRTFAKEILNSTARLERIVGMIVDFAALDSGRLSPRPEPVALAELIDEVLHRWRERSGGRNFRPRVSASLPPAHVDRAMLIRCLDELLDNAVKFSPGGEPVIVSAAAEPANPDKLRLSVRDHGVGIEPETAVQIFSDFYQVDATETRSFGGLGLGLALVRRMLDSLDGEARVESEVGQGSIFHLLLPVAAAGGTPPASGDRDAADLEVQAFQA